VKALLALAREGANAPPIRSTLYVGAVQAVTLLVPVVTLPWVLRALHPEAYGAYALAIAFGQYAVILVDFGFYLTSTQRIARMGDDRAGITKYFWTVQTARCVLAVAAAGGAVLIVFSVPKLHSVAPIILAYLPVILGALLYPQWLFFGLDRIREVSLVNVTAQAVSIFPIIMFVRTPDDAVLAAFIAASTTIVAGVISAGLIVRWKLVGACVLPNRAELLAVYKEAWPLFISTGAVSLYGASNAIVLGMVSGNYQVGLFNAADKLRKVSVAPIIALSTVFYPRVSRKIVENRSAAVGTILKLALVLCVGMSCVAVAMFVGAPLLVHVFMGAGFEGAIPVVQILSAVPLLVGVNTVLGSMAMLNLGMTKAYSRIILAGGLVNVMLLVVLGTSFGARGAAAALVSTELLVTAAMLVALHRVGFLAEASPRLWGLVAKIQPSRRGDS
jgi:O-antigen/teichoic acid export membrane protein